MKEQFTYMKDSECMPDDFNMLVPVQSVLFLNWTDISVCTQDKPVAHIDVYKMIFLIQDSNMSQVCV